MALDSKGRKRKIYTVFPPLVDTANFDINTTTSPPVKYEGQNNGNAQDKFSISRNTIKRNLNDCSPKKRVDDTLGFIVKSNGKSIWVGTIDIQTRPRQKRRVTN